ARRREPVGRDGRANLQRALLDERDVPPAVGAERPGVVIGLARQLQHAGLGIGQRVPLLARHLAGLAADADAGVGEEADPRRMLRVARLAGHVIEPAVQAAGHRNPLLHRVSSRPASRRYRITRSVSAGPRGRRPGLMSQVATLLSWMNTFGSTANGSRSLTVSPVTIPSLPQ